MSMFYTHQLPEKHRRNPLKPEQLQQLEATGNGVVARLLKGETDIPSALARFQQEATAIHP